MTDVVTRVLVVTGGHPFERRPFLDLLGSLQGVTCEHVEHPAAAERLHPDRLDADAVCFYDMPGVGFRPGAPPVALPPPASVAEGIEALLDAGVGIVALHHALASWPAWDRWAEIVGGRFHYAPASLAGRRWPDSGYAFGVEQTLTVLEPDHPVCAGLPRQFSLQDETYLCPLIVDGSTPLLSTSAPLDDEHHWSALAAVSGHMHDRTGWEHPAGVGWAAWTRAVGRSRVVYIQPGDGPLAYENPHFRTLLANSLHWVASAAH